MGGVLCTADSSVNYYYRADYFCWSSLYNRAGFEYNGFLKSLRLLDMIFLFQLGDWALALQVGIALLGGGADTMTISNCVAVNIGMF